MYKLLLLKLIIQNFRVIEIFLNKLIIVYHKTVGPHCWKQNNN